MRDDMGGVRAPSNDDLARVGEAILKDLGAEVQALIGDVAVQVQDWPDEETLDAMEIDDPLDLTGLYSAVPIGEAFAGHVPTVPNLIFLYRIPLLVEWSERGCTLREIVFDVLTHEIGHHFGMDEEAVLRMEGR